MNNIINLFKNQNLKVINLTTKINKPEQIENYIIKKVKDDKYYNICFILELNKLDDKIKKYIHEKYNDYDIENKEFKNNQNEYFILFYKSKFLHTFLNNNELTEEYIKTFIKYTDEATKQNKQVYFYYEF